MYVSHIRIMGMLQWYNLTDSWEDSICPKVDVIVQIEFEIAYYDSVVDRFNTPQN